MKIAILTLFFALTSLTETIEFKLDAGMTCGGCKKMVRKAICDLPNLEKCEVEIGSMILTSKEGTTLDQDAIKAALTNANEKYNEDYKISSMNPLGTKTTVETKTTTSNSELANPAPKKKKE